MLGNNYDADFFRDIKNNNIRSALSKIADETLEDLENFERVLKNYGASVIRPIMDRSDSIMNHMDSHGTLGKDDPERFQQGVPLSPLEPRNTHLVINDHLFCTLDSHSNIQVALDQYSTDNVVRLKDNVFSAPNYTLVNNDLLIDVDGGDEPPPWMTQLLHPSITNVDLPVPPTKYSLTKGIPRWELLYKENIATIKNLYPNINIVRIDEGGHTDGLFHTIKQDTILSVEGVGTHAKVFPNWDVCYLHNESWSKVGPFLSQKAGITKSWWVPDQEDNPDFQHFVNTWLSHWVGFCEESVFDVNVLVLDPETVCINNKNPTVIDFLKKHNMGYIHVPWRHRYFWDGGIHCITLDLKRTPINGN